MNNLIIKKSTLIDIADAIREKTGDLTKIQVGQLADEIEKIQIGEGALPNLSNPASIDEVLNGKEFINQNGSKKTGTMPNNGTISSTMDGITIKSITIPEGYTSGGTVSLDNTIDEEVNDQADLIAQIAAGLEGKAGGGGTTKKTITVTVNNECGNPVYYFDADGNTVSVPAYTNRTVEALSGFLAYNQVSSTYCTGDYVEGSATYFGSRVYIYLSDGGMMRCLAAGGGGSD